MTRGISIVICCYNSANRIKPTLQHLSEQKIKKEIDWEVVIVDNNCTDDTVEIALEEWNEFNVNAPLYIVKEVNPGLSQARIRGIQSAKYDYVIFCDDDNWFAPTYVQRAFEIMESDGNIGACGGRSEIQSDIELPNWFNTYRSHYAIGVQNIDSGFLIERHHVWGAGMVIRRKVLLELMSAGFTFHCSDRTGTTITSGGDSEICRWLLLVGFRLWYDEDLQFEHFIPKERLTKEYWRKLKKGFVDSFWELKLYDLALEAIEDQKQKRNQSGLFKLKVITDNLWAKLFHKSDYRNRRFELQRLFPNKKRLAVNKKYWKIMRARYNYLEKNKPNKTLLD